MDFKKKKKKNNETISSKKAFKFLLSYVKDNWGIGLTFSNFMFGDFLKTSESVPDDTGGIPWSNWYETRVRPYDDENIVLRSNVFYENLREFPATIVNSTGNKKAVWIADFRDSGVDDGEKQLLLSAILWASDKKDRHTIRPVKVGMSSYRINVKNGDIYEVYVAELGAGYPY